MKPQSDATVCNVRVTVGEWAFYLQWEWPLELMRHLSGNLSLPFKPPPPTSHSANWAVSQRSSSIKSVAVSQAVMWFDWFTLKIRTQTENPVSLSLSLPPVMLAMSCKLAEQPIHPCRRHFQTAFSVVAIALFMPRQPRRQRLHAARQQEQLQPESLAVTESMHGASAASGQTMF